VVPAQQDGCLPQIPQFNKKVVFISPETVEFGTPEIDPTRNQNLIFKFTGLLPINFLPLPAPPYLPTHPPLFLRRKLQG